MARALWVAAAWAVAGAANGADGPKIAPAEAWVKPAVLAKAGAGAPSATKATASVAVELYDQQLNFTPAASEIYLETVVRAQTTQGLAALGTIALPWKPDTDTLTVHKLLILRGDKTIDALTDHSFTLLRRETNLEAATLDGVLTATMQIEGLEVGDRLDMALTYTRHDPVMQGHEEMVLFSPISAPVDHFRMRALWAKPKSLRWRIGDGFPAAKLTKSGDASELTLDLTNVTPQPPPKGAPARFGHARDIEFSEFSSWADLSSLFAPLYAKAATLGPASPLKAEVEKIRAASADPVVRATMALALVQNQVRYVFLGMNDGGLTPADADLTWSRRFGDCKGKTVLLLALLHELGIEAEPALVSTNFGDGLDARLPTVEVFDHVLVRATIGGRTYWLDGTRVGDRDLAQIRTPPFRWALPVQAPGTALVPLVQTLPDKPDLLADIALDASQGLTRPAKVHAETTFRGDGALGLDLKLADLTDEIRNRALESFWNKTFSKVQITATSARFDPATGEEHWTMDGTAILEWDEAPGAGGQRYETDGSRLGWEAKFDREPGPHADAPFAVEFPAYLATRETIILPHQGEGFVLEGGDIDLTVAGRAFHRHVSLDKGVVTIETTHKNLAPEFPAAEASADAKAINALYDRRLFVRAPANYQWTAAEVAAITASEPKDAREFVGRGWAFVQQGQFAKAIADLDKAIVLDPTSAVAFQDRSIAHSLFGQLDQAKADAEKAGDLGWDPKAVAGQVGEIQARQGAFAEAAATYTQAIARFADDGRFYGARAEAEWNLGDDRAALADSDKALSLLPTVSALRLFRAEIFREMGQAERGRSEIDTALAAAPKDEALRLVHAQILWLMGEATAARADVAAALAAKPSAGLYLLQEHYRDRADIAGRQADLAAALKLAPQSGTALEARAKLEIETGAAGKAAGELTPMLAAHPEAATLQLVQGAAWAKADHADKAGADFAAVRRQGADNPGLLNNLCWTEAAFKPFLAAALADCETALKASPSLAEIIDSHAFVLLRLGRLDEALAEYDRALKFSPHEADSLFGRAIVETRKGLAPQAQADLAHARALDPTAGQELAQMGETP